ncbi:SNF2 family helicase [Alicycliphilus sp. B1]|nr:SNF2 family helicase [Alicycliphilus sp. B1]
MQFMFSKASSVIIFGSLVAAFLAPAKAQNISSTEVERKSLEIELRTIDGCARAAKFIIDAYDAHRTKEKLAAYMNDIFGALSKSPSKEGMLTEKDLMMAWLELHILIDTSGSPYAKEKREYYIARMAASCATPRAPN